MNPGIWCFIFALSFWVLENRHFGWNAWPKSDAELIADGLVFLMLCLSSIAYHLGESK